MNTLLLYSTGSCTYIFIVALCGCCRSVLMGRGRHHSLGGPSSWGSGTGCCCSPGRCSRGPSSTRWGAPHCATSGWAASSHASPGGCTARRHSSAPGGNNSQSILCPSTYRVDWHCGKYVCALLCQDEKVDCAPIPVTLTGFWPQLLYRWTTGIDLTCSLSTKIRELEEGFFMNDH